MWGPEGPRVSRPVCPWGTNVKFYSGRVTGREASLLQRVPVRKRVCRAFCGCCGFDPYVTDSNVEGLILAQDERWRRA